MKRKGGTKKRKKTFDIDETTAKKKKENRNVKVQSGVKWIKHFLNHPQEKL